MLSPELDRLVEIGQLEHEEPIREELEGLLARAATTLQDARRASLSAESRFTLAYSAAYALALAALRRSGYRPRNRQVAFQALAHTLGTPPPVWRMLARCHEQRNRIEYEGFGEVDERLLQDVIEATEGLLGQVRALPQDEMR